jgi:hypothetical protein
VKHTWNVGPGAAFRNDVTVVVRVDLSLEDSGVGDVSDGYEKAVHFLLPYRACGRILQPHSSHQLIPYVVDFLHDSVGEELDLGIVARAIQHDLRSAELVAAVHQGHLGAEACQEVSLFHGGVAAADHHDLLAAVEEAVTRGARTDPAADQLLLGFQAQPAGRCTGSNDQGASLNPLAFHVDAEGLPGKLGVHDVAMDIFSAEVLRLELDVLHQVGPVDTDRKAREVLYQGGKG